MKASEPNNGEDLISMLPDHILQLILSRLPATEEVVRTSILSTRWRYLWTLIPLFPSLDLDCTRAPGPLTDFKVNEFKEFVDSVLMNKTTVDLESFRLCCKGCYDRSTIEQWIHAAVMRKVKRLDLRFIYKFCADDYMELPHSVVKYDALEILKLFFHKRQLSLSRVSLFPVLRVLELNSVELPASDGDLLEQFLNSCPSLEDLSLINCFSYFIVDLCISCLNLKTLRIHNQELDIHSLEYDSEEHDEDEDDDDGLSYMIEALCGCLKISCPKLVFLEYVGQPADEVIFENLDSLKKAVIYPDVMAQKGRFIKSFGDNICQLAAEVSHVESLSLNLSFIKAINAARVDFPASLGNLKTLEISTTIDEYAMDVVIRILGCCPNLESFHLVIEEEIIWLETWELDEVLARHLKRVEFLEFDGEKQKLDMARFLLGHGNELEEMVFSWRDKVKYHEKSTEIMKEALKFNKASSTVKLTTLLKD